MTVGDRARKASRGWRGSGTEPGNEVSEASGLVQLASVPRPGN